MEEDERVSLYPKYNTSLYSYKNMTTTTTTTIKQQTN